MEVSTFKFLPLRIKVIYHLLSLIERIKFLDIFFRVNYHNYFLSKINLYFKAGVSGGYISYAASFPQISSYQYSLQTGNVKVVSFGSSFSKDEAMSKSFGEFLERVSAVAPLEALIENKFNFNKIANKDVVIKSLTKGKSFKVSRNSLYYGLSDKADLSNKIQKTTNGYAGYFDITKAKINAWVESIERDSFLVFWMNSIAPKRIVIEKYKQLANIKKIEKIINQYNLYPVFLDFTSDLGVPAMGCIIYSHGKTNFFGFGMSCGFNFEEIASSSFFEALGNANFSFEKIPNYILDSTYVPFIDNKIDRATRLSMYQDKDNFKKIEFMFSNIDIVSDHDFMKNVDLLQTDNQKLFFLQNLFKERAAHNNQYHVYFYEIKNTLLTLFNYKVVKIISPALMPIYLNESYANPDHPRLREFVKNKNLENLAKLNPFPHPFP